MAEVSQRLGTGAYRLATAGPGQVRTLCPKGTSGLLPINDARNPRHFIEESAQLAKRKRAPQLNSEKLSRVRKTKNQQKLVACLGFTSFSKPLARLLWLPEAKKSQTAAKTSLLMPPGRHHDTLFSCMKPPWTRGAVSTHPNACMSPQQLRTLCTVLFILAEDRSGRGASPNHLKRHPDTFRAYTAARSYSRSSEEVPLLHRSKTAYYDILKVSPSATQSQIKTAYYKQSFIYHPDKNLGRQDATQRFSQISEAYTVLGNISLRRKYDRGILSQSDLQSAGKPSSKYPSSRSTGSQQQHYQHRARQFSHTGGKPMFDFDAFFQAHYGEQLQREKELREKKKRMEEMHKEKVNKFKEEKILELTLIMLVGMSGLFFISLSKP